MTDRGRQARRLAALSLVPLSVGGFGGAVSWAASHQAAAAPPAPVPAATTTTTDPQLTQALAEIADARDRIAALQATLDQRAAAAAAVPAPGAAQPAAAPPAKAPAAKAPAAAPARPAPAPPPPVHTTTKASG